MASSIKEFPLENDGDYTTRIVFSERGGVRYATFIQPAKGAMTDEEAVCLNAAQFQEAIRLSIGSLFPIHKVDDVLLVRHLSDQMLALISQKENELMQIACSSELFLHKINMGRHRDLMIAMIRSCITIAILSLRAVTNPPVQENGT